MAPVPAVTKERGLLSQPSRLICWDLLIGGSGEDALVSRPEAAEAEVWTVSRVLPWAAEAAEIPSVCPEREPVAAPPSVAPADTRERVATRLPRARCGAL